jgi:cell wall-associated NlpC family hydrolase
MRRLFVVFCFLIGGTYSTLNAQISNKSVEADVIVSESIGLPEINALLQEAYTHMGTRYRGGGKSPQGFDCSGFVGYCYSSVLGIKTPASSSGFHSAGIQVSVSEAKPGDVICFTGSNASRRISGHVGIITEVTDSNVYFIHSATSSGIRIDSVNQPYYKNRFLEIRRFF